MRAADIRQELGWSEEEAQRAADSRSRCQLCPNLVDDPLTGCVMTRSRGSVKPRVLVVGEAPGADESRKGECFVGPAAVHGERLLANAGIPLETVRYTSIVRCFTHKPDRSPRPPTKPEIMACSPYLFDEISLCEPEVIIAFGAVAAHTLTGNFRDSITTMAGKFYRTEIRGKEYLVVASVHPSADLRSDGRYKNSILRAASLAWGLINQVEVPVRTNILNSTWEAKAYLEGLLQQYSSGEITEAAYDLEYETSMVDEKSEANRLSNLDVFDPEKKLVAAAFATKPDEGFSIPLYANGSRVDFDEVAPLLRKVVTTIPMIVHGFLKAEGPWTREKLGVVPKLHRDTMLMNYVLYMRTKGHGLKGMAKEHLGWGDWSTASDAWLNDQPPETRSYRHMPVDLMGKYSAIDPAATLALKIYLEEEITKEDLWGPYQRRHDLSYTLLDIEERGVLVDMEMLERLREEYPKRADEALSKVRALPECGDDFNPRSSAQLGEVLFGRLGAQVFKMNPSVRYDETPSSTVYTDLKAGMTRLPIPLDLRTKRAYIGRLEGEVGGEVVEIQDTDVGTLVLKKPLRRDHPSPVTISRGSPSADDETVVKLLNESFCVDCEGAQCSRCDGSGILPAKKKLYDFLFPLRRYKKIKKLVGDYLETIPKNLVPGTNRLTINYLSHVTDTGRLAARNMNIHSFPASSDIRRLLVSRWYKEGGLVSQMDQSQLEMRVLASVTKDERFIEVYFTCSNPSCQKIGNETDKGKCSKCGSPLGGDLHTMTASQIFGKSAEDVSKSERRYSKTISFGIVYGASAYSISDQTGLSIDDSDAMIKRFMKQFPQVAQWIKSQHKIFDAQGWTRSPLGTKLYFEYFDSDRPAERGRGKRQSQNYSVQSPAAEMVIDSLTDVNNRMKKSFRSHPWETTHDSIVFDLHPEEILPAIRLGKSCMEELTLDKHPWMIVPLIADVNLGVRWDGDLVVDEIDGDQLRVSGAGVYYDELIYALQKNYRVHQDIISKKDKKVDETITVKSGYVGEPGRTDVVEAIIRWE